MDGPARRGTLGEGESRRAVRFGLTGGPRLGLSADRPLGWSASARLEWRNVLGADIAAMFDDQRSVLAPRDIHVELGVQSLADVHFIGVVFGIAGRGPNRAMRRF